MVYTEVEATYKECPMSKAGASDRSENTMCTGSKCLAWRWYQYKTETRAARGYCGIGGDVSIILTPEDM